MGWNSKKLLYCGILHQHPQIFANTKFRPKIKILKFGTNIALIEYFGIEFQKTNIVFEISTLKFVYAKFCKSLQNFAKMSKFGTKNALFGYFWAGIWKQNCHIWNQHLWICLIAKFREIMKMPKFETKNALFGYFWVRIFKNYCHILNQHPWIYLFAKFGEKAKIPKFGTKNALFGYFWARFLNNYCHI